MPEGRFYEDYVEQNKKQDTKRIKKKINNRVILFLLVLILCVYLIFVNIQNRTAQKEESLKVETAESYEGFEEKTLTDGSIIKIKKVIADDNKGIVYILKKLPDGTTKEVSATPININDIEKTLEIHEEGINIKIFLNEKRVEEKEI